MVIYEFVCAGVNAGGLCVQLNSSVSLKKNISTTDASYKACQKRHVKIVCFGIQGRQEKEQMIRRKCK